MKRVAFFIVLVLVVIGFGWWLVHYLTTGHITITTNNPNTVITLTKIPSDDNDDSSSSKPFSEQAHNRLSVTLSTGQYTATVQYNSQAITQVINLKPHQNLTYALNAPVASSIEPVTYQNAANLAADSSHIIYTDSAGNLNQIDSQNTVSHLNSSISFQGIKWANANYGVGQGTNGKLYTIDSGLVQVVNSPASLSSQVNFYTIAPDKEIYYSVGSKIYDGTPATGFKQLYTDKKAFTSLSASDGKVAVITSQTDGGTPTTPSVVVVNNSGTSQRKSISLPPSVAWSPNGAYLASTDVDDGDGLEIYTSKLQKVIQIPGDNRNNIVWIDNNTVAYSANGELWTYSLTTQRANLIANTPLGAGITGLVLSDDGAYLYATTLSATSGTSASYAIERVGLQGQAVPPILTQLQDILPEAFSTYSLGLINFTHPTIVVTPYEDSDAGSDQQAAVSQLQQLGFNTSALSFETVSVSGQ